MSQVENIAALITIVFGLMLTDFFASVHRLIRKRRLIRWHWLPIVVAWYVLAVVLKNWWGLVIDDSAGGWSSGWTFFYYGHLLLLLYLWVSATLPDEVPPEGLDLRAYYLDTRRHFWGLLAAINLILLGYTLIKSFATGSPLNWPAIFGNSIMMMFVLSLAWVRRFWYHVVIVALMVLFTIQEIVGKF